MSKKHQMRGRPGEEELYSLHPSQSDNGHKTWRNISVSLYFNCWPTPESQLGKIENKKQETQ